MLKEYGLHMVVHDHMGYRGHQGNYHCVCQKYIQNLDKTIHSD